MQSMRMAAGSCCARFASFCPHDRIRSTAPLLLFGRALLHRDDHAIRRGHHLLLPAPVDQAALGPRTSRRRQPVLRPPPPPRASCFLPVRVRVRVSVLVFFFRDDAASFAFLFTAFGVYLRCSVLIYGVRGKNCMGELRFEPPFLNCSGSAFE